MIAWLAYLAADLVVRLLPSRFADRLCVILARAAFYARLPARRAQEANLARLLGEPPGPAIRERARESFEHFALSFSDILRLDRIGPDALRGAVEVRGEDAFQAARGSGRGVVLLSAHLGNWEWGAAWLAARGERVHLLARPHPSPRVERLYRRLRRAWGVSILPAGAPWSHAARALRRGEWVALMADRPRAGRAAGRGRSERWSGSACAFAAALARRTGALVLPAVILHLPGRRYAACFEPPLAIPSQADGIRAASRTAAVSGEGFGAILRRYLRSYPGQWCAFEPASEALG